MIIKPNNTDRQHPLENHDSKKAERREAKAERKEAKVHSREGVATIFTHIRKNRENDTREGAETLDGVLADRVTYIDLLDPNDPDLARLIQIGSQSEESVPALWRPQIQPDAAIPSVDEGDDRHTRILDTCDSRNDDGFQKIGALLGIFRGNLTAEEGREWLHNNGEPMDATEEHIYSDLPKNSRIG